MSSSQYNKNKNDKSNIDKDRSDKRDSLNAYKDKCDKHDTNHTHD